MKIAFLHPNKFYRTSKKTNPFFDPIMAVCDDAEIKYEIYEQWRPVSSNGYENVKSFYWIDLWEILGHRLLKWFPYLPARPLWLLLGWWANALSFGRYRADMYIVVAGGDLEVLQGVNPKARVVDLQHGVIYSTHNGYFDKTRRLAHHTANNPQREYWLYGEGYRQCFYHHPDNAKLLGDRVHIIGDVLGASMPITTSKDVEKDAIVFSLQFTHDYEAVKLVSIKRLIEQMFDRIINAGLLKKYKVFLKHHPRYNNCIDLTSWQRDYPWAQFTTEATVQLVARAAYHVTMHSTTTFEYASAGVPTCFLWSERIPDGKRVMLDDFQYVGTGDFAEMLAYLNDTDEQKVECSRRISSWYQSFYSPFNKQTCLCLLTLKKV